MQFFLIIAKVRGFSGHFVLGKWGRSALSGFSQQKKKPEGFFSLAASTA